MVEQTGSDTMVLWLAYDGGPFAGFQLQPGRDTVQSALEAALAKLLGPGPRVAPAGRTDAGVHARCQVVSIPWRGCIEPGQLPLAVNSLLPPEVRVWGAVRTPGAFHARFDSRSKTYRYTIVNTSVALPFWSRYAITWRGALDVEAMVRASSQWVGRHDFSCFQVSGRPVENAVRTVTQLAVSQSGPVVVITVAADGFLYKMVRSMVGTLLEVGRGAIDADAATAILVGRSRALAGPTAPAHGLMLWSVDYGTQVAAPVLDPRLAPFLTLTGAT